MKLDQKIYTERRRALLDSLKEGSVLVLPSATEKVRNRDCEYHFRQDSDFWYLTGFGEPEAVLVLIPGREEGESVLFCRERNREMEIWNGRRAGQAGAVKEYGFDQAFVISELNEQMPGLLDQRTSVYHTPGANKEFDQQLWSWMDKVRAKERKGGVAPEQIEDRDKLLHTLRMIKSPAEQALMRKAGEISARAHTRAMQECKPGVTEYQLEASIHHEFAMSGARHPAYTTIVGGGENACILHYTENECELKDGDLVLIDAGCELDHYAADITRTFPVNGKFSPEQKALYNVVLDAQLAAIDEVAPGKPFDGFHKAALGKLVEGLLELGLLAGNKDKLIKEEAYRAFYMHGTGHWLGMDVHDVGHHKEDGESILFKPGMAVTVEPGLYVSPDNQDVEERWRGIGIRIEDDVLVTETGNEVLTAGVVKTVDAIEALMG
ncbi:Xaa-Pro aminopeptidase [Parendozoicomonas sp. Alg238-R29]|uniref:Xaa-Pro aminopeptidase n=1 Tax=Parendozoicomonas sp. Alg238-R29 TaxID=2993446 RepID=UPI00248D877C|nr:Xaa-Pro aminopeptidase [Parendozoicomonas sp. Alg238-R29]